MRYFGKKLLNILTADAFILFALMCIMFYLRVFPIHGTVFTNWSGPHGNYVNFASDDAIYHMRLVHNTLHHFPWRVFFDPFTHFPFGSQIHFGPFFTLLIASIAMLLGLGHPSAELANAVGAYFPAVLGALCILPTYFIGKKIFGKNAGILTAAALAFAPGEFFERSTLGFTDHHVAEVFFSTCVFAFLVYALDEIANFKNRSWKYAFGAGIFFGLYILSWPAAILIGAIIFIYFLWQFIIDHHLHKPRDHLLPIAAWTFLLPILMVLPYSLLNPRLQLGYYSLTQPVLLALFIVSLFIIYLTSRLLDKSKLKRWFYPLSLIGIITTAILLIHMFAPGLYNLIVGGIKLLFKPRSGMLTVSEVWPSIIDRYTGEFTFNTLRYEFFLLFPFSIAAMALLIEKIWRKNNKPSELLLLVWSVVVLFATFAQTRFAYYYAVNAALLSGYFIISIWDYLKEVFFTDALIKNYKFRALFFYITLILLAFGLAYPATSLAPKHTLDYGPRLTQTSYDMYLWMRNFTPDPQGKPIRNDFSYAAGYYPIPKNIDARYEYPSSAYGIMNWWDVGHQITYAAERIPCSNPFQEGIIEDNKLGAAPFFTADNETAALANLDALGARYVFIDNSSASKQYGAMLYWQGIEKKRHEFSTVKIKKTGKKNMAIKIPYDGREFYASMLNKLYYEDGNGLEHFRLIHESRGPYIVNVKSYDIKTKFNDQYYKVANDNYDEMQRLYLRARRATWLDAKKRNFIYDAKPPVKWGKIFEKVKGAIITGKTAAGGEVTLNLTLLTNNGRLIIYTKKTRAFNGEYRFIVPYPTEQMKGDGYNYDVTPMTKYRIKTLADERLVEVSETDVMQGNTLVAFPKGQN